jgi:DedD protein
MDEALKTRLVGAAVLLALLAILWPLMFDDAEQIKLSRESQIPAKPAVQKWQPAEMSLPDAAQTGWPKPEESAEEKPKPQPAPDKATPSASKTLAEKPAPADKPAAKPTTAKPKPKADNFRPSWVIQVASLGDEANAKKLVNKLRADGYRAYSKAGQSSGKAIYRVMVGPKFEKRKALSIKKAVDKAYAVNALVLRFEP